MVIVEILSTWVCRRRKGSYNSQHMKSRGVVMVWGVCVCLCPVNTSTNIWLCYLDTFIGLTDLLKGP